MYKVRRRGSNYEWESNAVLWLQGFGTTVLKIKNAVVVVVLIFLKHNSLRGQAINSSQLWQVHSAFDNFHNSWPSQEVVPDKIILKGCVRYIFTSLLFLSLNESTCQTKKYVFYITSKALFVLKKIKF